MFKSVFSMFASALKVLIMFQVLDNVCKSLVMFTSTLQVQTQWKQSSTRKSVAAYSDQEQDSWFDQCLV